MILGEMENTNHYQTAVAYEDCVKRMALLDKKIAVFKKVLVAVSILMLVLCLL